MAKPGPVKAKKEKPKATVVGPLMALVSPERAATHPDVPVKVAIAEARRLAARAKSHASDLGALPYFDEGRVGELRALVRSLRGADREVARAKRRLGDRPRVHARRRAEDWRREALAALRYVVRDDDALASAAAIRETDDVGELVQTLDELVSLIGPRSNLFSSLPEPLNLADGIGLAATLRGAVDDPTVIVAVDTRNRAFWALEDCVADIRAALAFAFRSDPKKLAALLTRHERRSPVSA